MGTQSDAGFSASRRRRRARAPRLVVAAVALVLAVVAGAALVAAGEGGAGSSLRLPWTLFGRAESDCPATTVRLVVAPEIIEVAQDVLAGTNDTRLADGRCLRVDISSQAPRDTVQDAARLPESSAPDLWIPDSSLWPAQVDDGWRLRRVAGLAQSPVVLATGQAAVERLGWTRTAPTWAQALGGPRPITVPGLAANGAGISALLGLWQSLGRGPAAQQAVASAVLASERGRAITADQILRAAARNRPDAPLLLTSELTVFATNRGRDRPTLVAVYPKDPAPPLDYPILQVAPRPQDAVRTSAVTAVIGNLTSDAARATLRQRGLRDAPSATRPGAPPAPPGQAQQTLPPAPVLQGFVARIALLARPARLLTVIDVSASMRARVPASRLNRIELAAQAAVTAGNRLPDTSAVGLWVFAAQLDGTLPFIVLSPTAQLGTVEQGGRTHRRTLINQLNRMEALLSPGGTALYATIQAAMQEARATYDPDAVNSVVVFTDGRNENDRTVAFARLVRELQAGAAANPSRPVSLIAIGIGPDADLPVLRALSEATGGRAYRANSVDAMQRVILDALASRR